MAENYGVWTGIGQGLGEFGEAISRRRERQSAERDKQAESYEKQAQDIAKNIAQVGGRDAPEAQPMLQELYGVVTRHNALYPMHETPALIARIGKVFGKQPGPPTPDLRASMTVGGALAQAPRPDLQVKYGQAKQFLRQAHPDWTEEQINQKAVEFVMPEKTAGTKLYRSADGKQQDYFVPGSQPEGWNAVGQGFGTADKSKLGQLTQAAIASNQFGSEEEARRWAGQQMVDAETADIRRKQNSTPMGQMKLALIASHEATSDADAEEKAGKWYVDVQNAKKKATEDTGPPLTPEEAYSLARADIINKTTTSFGLGKSADRTLYNKAKAILESGGGLTRLIQTRATAGALSAELTKLETQRGPLDGFHNTLLLNLDQVEKTSQNVGRYGSTLANDYLLAAQGKLTEYPELAQFRVAVQTAVTEYARITSSATGGAVTSDSARQEAQDLLNPAMSKGTVEAAVAQMRIDARNRITGLDQTIANTKQELGNIQVPNVPSTQAPPPPPPPPPQRAVRPGYIRVRDKNTKQTGQIPESQFDPNKYERLQ